MCREGDLILEKCPKEIIEHMHDYLDDEITYEQETALRQHLQRCPECQSYFHELKKTIALVQSTSHIQAPSGFTANVMARLPKEKKRLGVQRWMSSHPLITAASLFFILMFGTLFSSFNGSSNEFSVSNNPKLIVENNTVTVPEGEVVEEDIVVRNGKIRIEGKVEGNVTVINGENYLASAGEVTGKIDEVDQAFDWMWYQLKSTFKAMIKAFD